MFKSVFTKYLTALMSIIIAGFAIIGVIVSLLFVNYTVETKKTIISRCSSSVVNYMKNDCEINDKPSFDRAVNKEYSAIRSFISMVSPFSDELIFMICDSSGLIMISDSNVPYGYIIENIPDSDMESIRASHSMVEVELKGVFEKKHYSYATPYYGSNGEFLGTVVVSSSSQAMTDMVSVLAKTIIITTLWVIVVAFLVCYIVTERNVKPLRNMTKAAKRFALGDFESRVEVKGKDEIAELAASFNSMAVQLASLEDTRRSFLANIAHDLRTPMTTISGFIDNILAGAIPPEKQDYYLEIVQKEVRRLSRLVSLLLDISRIEAGDRKFNFEKFDICEMARMILISFESKIDEKKLDVEFNCDEDNIIVVADKDAIHQVLYNICHNAIKFSYEKGKYIIDIKCKDKLVYVRVFNEGVGIPEDELPFVFDRFYKNDKSRGLDKTGVGLGMYITKTIMDSHNQSIRVDSEYGKYCEFEISLQKADK